MFGREGGMELEDEDAVLDDASICAADGRKRPDGELDG